MDCMVPACIAVLWLSTCVLVNGLEGLSLSRMTGMSDSLSCLLGWCLMQGLRCHFILMSGKSPIKLEVTSQHDHSCLLGRKASNQSNKENVLLAFSKVNIA